MPTFVLVPGAWLGGWCWRWVVPLLHQKGHIVYTPSLTGLGERVHLGTPDTTLDTHITDVVNLIAYEDLQETILVGHSYAGAVITGVADRVPDRLAQVVYLDSAPLNDGASIIDLYPPAVSAELRQQADRHGDGWRLPFPEFEQLAMTASLAGLGASERALLTTKATAQPLGTYLQPLQLGHTGASHYRRVLIVCDDFRDLLAAGLPQLQHLAPPAWRRYDLATGHWPMLSAPGELAEVLHGLTTAR